MRAAEFHGTAADQRVVYVYGVTRARRQPHCIPLRLDGIVPDTPVEPLVDANLIAFVSTVPAAQFGPSGFRSALNDPQWLKDRILAHERVLETLMSNFDVVPFRFGTIYLDTLQASDALAGHRAELIQALERIRNASEWGVKLFCDQGKLRRQIETESVSLGQLRDMLGRASPGARFFLQKKYATALDGEIAAAVVGRVDRIRRSLDGCACESTEIEVQPAAVHGRSATMVMNAAYLVAKNSLRQFRQLLAALREDFATYGFDCELTGPWPPYHFVSARQEGIGDGAASVR